MAGIPGEPYGSILRYLAGCAEGAFYPRDSETRTFLHDIPVGEQFNSAAAVYHLKKRRAAVFKDGTVVSQGTVSPEEAFISFSSVCFAGYVKFMSDALADIKRGTLSKEAENVLKNVLEAVAFPPVEIPAVATGPFSNKKEAESAIIEAGRITVENRLVDSFFGNISVKTGDTVYITGSGSSLDELDGCIDPCPVDNSSSNAITASSELKAHMGIYRQTEASAVLHGHPRFSVILSMDCDLYDCKNRGDCNIACTEERYVQNIPVVTGEVGTGRFGLFKTVPDAMKKSSGVIVYGHGLFTRSDKDFQDALKLMFDTERGCINEFINLAG